MDDYIEILEELNDDIKLQKNIISDTQEHMTKTFICSLIFNVVLIFLFFYGVNFYLLIVFCLVSLLVLLFTFLWVKKTIDRSYKELISSELFKEYLLENYK